MGLQKHHHCRRKPSHHFPQSSLPQYKSKMMAGRQFGTTRRKRTISTIDSPVQHSGPILEYLSPFSKVLQASISHQMHKVKHHQHIPAVGGYDPAVHGDYDENAWYAQPSAPEGTPSVPADPATIYQQSAAFNRFTGRFQNEDLNPENFNDENKSKRQMNAFFDVDAAANSHDGKSLKAERSGKKLSKSELKHFKEKRKAKKEEKRKAWLRD